jgi:ankyrin repeat protein
MLLEKSSIIKHSLNREYSYDNRTVLHEACKKCDLQLIKVLLKQKFVIKNSSNKGSIHKATPLHIACRPNYYSLIIYHEIIKILLQHDDIKYLLNEIVIDNEHNSFDYHEYTPLTYLCENKEYEMILLLIKRSPWLIITKYDLYLLFEKIPPLDLDDDDEYKKILSSELNNYKIMNHPSALYCLYIKVSQNEYKINITLDKNKKLNRLFYVLSKIPNELKMKICNLVFDNPRCFIDTEKIIKAINFFV